MSQIARNAKLMAGLQMFAILCCSENNLTEPAPVDIGPEAYFEVFINEGAAGIKVGDPLSKVIDLHGSEFKEMHQKKLNLYQWQLVYSAKGLEFWTFWEDDELSKLSAPVSAIIMTKPYPGFTDKGIGIGSSRTDVLREYAGGELCSYPNANRYKYEDNWFSFSLTKVRLMQVGIK